jgi:hypothetical protein
MLYPTNTQEAFKFVTFLEEGLCYVDAWTPTEINQGGCGVFALLLSNKLDEVKVPYKIIGICLDKEEIKQMPKRQAEKFLKYLPYTHFLIAIDSLYFDSRGIENPLVANSKYEYVTKEQLKGYVDFKEMDIWNPVFDRECEKDIVDKLNEIFSQYNSFKEGTFKFPKKGDVEFTDKTMKNKMKDNPIAMLSRMLR